MAYCEFAKIYDELINEDIDYKKIGDKVLDICERYNVDKKSYLDLACGTGNVSIEIAKQFKEDILQLIYLKKC